MSESEEFPGGYKNTVSDVMLKCAGAPEIPGMAQVKAEKRVIESSMVLCLGPLLKFYLIFAGNLRLPGNMTVLKGALL